MLLREFLERAGPGPIQDVAALVPFLAAAWPAFDGGDAAGMASRKLERIEAPRWNPPILAFDIERHGGIVAGGSTRGEVQTWELDFDRFEANISASSRRQVYRMALRLDVSPPAAEIAALIEASSEDPRLRWSADRQTVTVLLSSVIPNDGFKQTVQGRRKRLQSKLTLMLEADGWRPAERRATYTRTALIR